MRKIVILSINTIIDLPMLMSYSNAKAVIKKNSVYALGGGSVVSFLITTDDTFNNKINVIIRTEINVAVF